MTRKTILTHDSGFHADDVFAVATLLILEPDALVKRSREDSEIERADYVVDVGLVHDVSKNRFDHHQLGGAGKRENGIQYASFGLVWKEFGERVSGGKSEAEIIDSALVQPIDAHDNGIPLSEFFYEDVRYFTIGDFFQSFITKNDYSEEELLDIFLRVVQIAKDLILREVEKAHKLVEDENAVRLAYESAEDKRLIILDKEYSWGRFLMKKEEPIYVIYPRKDGKWSVRGMPLSNKLFGSLRKPLPASWGGKNDGELAEVTGVEDATFAHRGLFIAVARSKEGALELANKALNA